MTMIENDSREEFWQEYAADMLASLFTAVVSIGGKKPNVPLYSEIVHRKYVADNRTAAQIKNDLVKKLTA